MDDYEFIRESSEECAKIEQEKQDRLDALVDFLVPFSYGVLTAAVFIAFAL